MATTPAEVLALQRSLRRYRRVTLSQIDRLLVTAIATGESAASVAKKIGQYLSPWFSEARTGRFGLRRQWPAQAGMASRYAELLMRHEANVAHGEGVVRSAKRRGKGVKWNTSGGHVKPDECDEKRDRDGGYGPGIFLASEVPTHPGHRLCQCVLSAVDLPDTRRATQRS